MLVTLEVPRDRLGRPLKPMMRPEYRLGVTPPNAGKKYPAEVLTREEVAALLAACGRGKAGTRNRAMIVMAVRGGLRCAEVLALEPRDVDLASGEVLVRHGKGDRSRRVGLDDEAIAVQERWVAVREKLGIPRGRRFYCTITAGNIGQPVSGSYVRGLMPELGRRAGIEKRCHFHGLRHTCAYQMLREGIPLDVIQAMLGHGSLATTERYTRHLRPGDVIETMRRRDMTRAGEPPASAGDLLQALRANRQAAELLRDLLDAA